MEGWADLKPSHTLGPLALPYEVLLPKFHTVSVFYETITSTKDHEGGFVD